MRIAIDARMRGAGKTRGIGRYIDETVAAMQALDPSQDYVLLEPPVRWYTLDEQWKMPSLFAAAKADVVWVPHWNVPLVFPRIPLVITIHDLLLLHQPASAKASTRGPIVARLKRLGHRLVLWHAIRRASRILVPTRAVAADVVERYPSAHDRIVVTGEGISRLPSPEASDAFPHAPFLFYFGSAYPHKRLDLLLEAWSVLATRHPGLHLVIAGEQDVFLRRIMERARTLNLERIHFPGRLTDGQLADGLVRAEAHVHPSSFEGFALPSLEALSLGCPTVVADIPLMREVLPKEGVFFFKNGDSDGMIRAIEEVLRDREACHASARQGGEVAARTHDWKRVARLTLDTLLSVAHTY
ncbi:MAG TPA: glycosyltransferase family 1 protein [Verrucomicrobiae bacterium]|nr:glycosyltransferase family 1 protein [Verrucomicrobiae bacterium]